jgi:hypothetical protein
MRPAFVLVLVWLVALWIIGAALFVGHWLNLMLHTMPPPG